MSNQKSTQWNQLKSNSYWSSSLNFLLDYSRITGATETIGALEDKAHRAFEAMKELEAGALANPDEKRMVGHYWLRAPACAPSTELRSVIERTLADIKTFVSSVHQGKITNGAGEPFTHAIIVGIGGSALGPQFVYQALRTPTDPIRLFFFDNTDPDGMQRVLDDIGELSRTLVIVVSKSGGTKETRNGQLIAKAAFQLQKLSVSNHFIAVTGEGSELDTVALKEKWLARFPMWDWVGGRTSETSAVGLLPAALHGAAIDELLRGAAEMDTVTRRADIRGNPAMLLALMWFSVGKGKGTKDMVILPYKDRLELFSRYLQQLVMESLGKEHDLQGNVVNQGLAVYGNKGSTDQHAYVQQLRDGIPNFFAVFINVLKAGPAPTPASSLQVEPGITSGDYLLGFLLGTRTALSEKQRESITITIGEADAFGIGMLIALFERAVGFYASLVGINAYHQPGVEAGKKAAAEVLEIQRKITGILESQDESLSAPDLAALLGIEEQTETIFHILRHLSANGVLTEHLAGEQVFDSRYYLTKR